MNEYEIKLEQIIEIASVLNHETVLDEMLRLISVKAMQIFDCEFVTISILNRETQNTIRTIYKDHNKFRNTAQSLLNSNISGWIIKNKADFLSNDLINDKRIEKKIVENSNIKSVLGILLYAYDEPNGVILLTNQKSKKIFSELDLNLARKLASVISSYIYRIQEIHNYFTCTLEDEDLINKYSKFGLVGKSQIFISLLKSIESASKCNVRVLLEGETGTGKEVIARAIHFTSNRSLKKFVVVDCAAIPPNLIESELFGHKKGAFTGAINDRIGLIEEANLGTLFLDEINHLPSEMQIKLLRFLQEKEFRRVGSNELRKADVRIIAASSVSLIKMVKEKKLREELFYRLNVYPIYVPSLNDRKEDITMLSNHFMKIFAAQQDKKVQTFDLEVTKLLLNRSWIGNVRELQNVIERLVSLTPENVEIITKEYLPKEFLDEYNFSKKISFKYSENISLPDKLNEIESQLIREALVLNEWNQSKAAQYLNIPEQTIRYKMKKFAICKSE